MMITYQVEDTLGVFLVFSALCKEEQSLSCLLCMCRIGVSDVLGFLITEVSGEVLVFHGSIAEPKVFL